MDFLGVQCLSINYSRKHISLTRAVYLFGFLQFSCHSQKFVLRERNEVKEGGERNWCCYDDGGGRREREILEGGRRKEVEKKEGEERGRERQAYCSVCKFVPQT